MSGDYVVGYDGSDGARAALRVAARLAAQSGTGVVAAFAAEPPAALAGGDDQRRALEARGAELVVEAEALVGDIAPTTGRVLADKPAPGLIALAEEIDAAMIVLGTYSERPLAAALVGSTPHKLLHLSTIPVVVVPARPSGDE